MNIISRLMASLGGEPTRNASDDRAWGVGSPYSAAGVAVTAQAALDLDIVQAILEVLADSVSTLPLMVFERLEGGERKPAVDLPLFKLLHERPNARQTKQEFFDEQQRHLAFYRNAYAQILAGEEGPIGSLEPIHPARVKQIWRDASGRVHYRIAAQGAGADFTLRDDEIWHVRKAPLTSDGLRGVAVYESAKEVFGRAIAVETYGARWFANSGQSGGTLEHPGKFATLEDREQFLASWRASGTGANQHRDRLLTHGVKYAALTVQNDQAQFIETVQHVETKICGLWQMPPHRVSRLARATNNNIEHQSIDYVVHTLAPWIHAWEQAAARDLLVGGEQDRYFVEFNVDGLLRGDITARFRAYAQGRQWGWLSVNDIRRKENQPPVEGGDVYLQPSNMQPAGANPNES